MNFPFNQLTWGGACLSVLLVWGLCCGHPGPASEPQKASAAAMSAPGETGSGARSIEPGDPSKPTVGTPAEGAILSSVPFGEGEKAFLAVKETLRSKYYRTGITDDELYRAAVAGMLQLLEPQMSAWNKLLSPEEMRELQADMKGEIVGIGAEIRFDEESGISDVMAVIPHSPAEKAGMRAGDKILAVAGKLYKGKTLRDVMMDLRGQPGEVVQLSTLRGAEVQKLEIRRERVAIDAIKTLLLSGDVGYLFIRQFSDHTPSAVQAALKSLLSQNARAIILDLRGNQGGLFDKAVATAELFLAEGTPIVKVRHRGDKEQTLHCKAAGIARGMPIALLIDHETASSAELLSGALREGAEAQLIGQRTFGKGSIQMLEELPNHYAYKYTSSVFLLPSEKPIDGQGLIPDVEVALPVPSQSNYGREISRVQRITNPAERLQADVPLRAALNIIRLRIRAK